MQVPVIRALTGLGVLLLVTAATSSSPSPVRTIQQDASPRALPAPVPRAGMTAIDVGTLLSRRELAVQSAQIVVGTAVDRMTQWSADGRNLYTLVTVAVEQTLKGDASESVIVALPGGIDANRRIPIAMTYPGGPQIGHGEEAVLFLTPADDEVPGARAITGFSQGKFVIESGPPPDPSLRMQRAERTVRVGDSSVPLSAFLDEIRSYIQP
jgi:hypothetical protein